MNKLSSHTNIKSHFSFNDKMIYLNHGSFGACPKPVFEDYQNWQRKLEFSPFQFILKEFNGFNAKSKEKVTELINCDPADFVFTTNPTLAMNTVIHSLELNEGDEILSTNLEYGAMDRTWDYYCEKTGAKYIQQPISLPIKDKETFLEEYWSGLTSKTKYVFISQITSTTALILPIKEICDKARELGLITIIDGAHVPGHIPLDLKDLNPDYYTGACHKWLLTPKGCSFLYTKRSLQDAIDPLVVSWGYKAEFPGESTYLDYLEYAGTNDRSAFLTLPAAFQFFKDTNWFEETAKCRAWIRKIYPEFCELLGTEPICPVTDEFLGQLCAIPINTPDPEKLQALIFSEYHIEIPITKMEGRLFLRITLQPYNSEEDLDALRNALKDIMQKYPELLLRG